MAQFQQHVTDGDISSFIAGGGMGSGRGRDGLYLGATAWARGRRRLLRWSSPRGRGSLPCKKWSAVTPSPDGDVSSTPRPLSSLDPLPGPAPYDVTVSRHAPGRDDLRTFVRTLGGRWDWAALGWAELVEALLVVGRTDVPRARLTEGHADALRIADQAGHRVALDALYGVWASRSGATGVRALRTGAGLRLSGELRFASGAGVIDRALVPVWLDDDTHQLVDLDVRALPVDASVWHTAAMTVSHTHTVDVRGVEVEAAALVGAEGFYFGRPAFLPGGVGVAAVWVGALGRVCDLLLHRMAGRATPAADLRLGRARTALAGAAAAVRQAGLALDGLLTPDGRLRGEEQDPDRLPALCTETRAVVGVAVDSVLTEVRVLAGPAGLAFDAALTHAVDDLALYALQQSRDGDAGALGRAWREG